MESIYKQILIKVDTFGSYKSRIYSWGSSHNRDNKKTGRTGASENFSLVVYIYSQTHLLKSRFGLGITNVFNTLLSMPPFKVPNLYIGWFVTHEHLELSRKFGRGLALSKDTWQVAGRRIYHCCMQHEESMDKALLLVALWGRTVQRTSILPSWDIRQIQPLTSGTDCSTLLCF